jgi:hypothetical protein
VTLAEEVGRTVAGISGIDLLLSKRDSPDSLVSALRSGLTARSQDA